MSFPPPDAALVRHARAALDDLLRFAAPADQTLSRYFREHRELGQKARGFIAEATFAVLRRRRSLAAAAGSEVPHALLVAALLRVLGFSGRALEGLADEDLVRRIRAAPGDALPDAVRADLPDWLWQRLEEEQGRDEAMRIAQGLLNSAPLDLRVNLARASREEVLARLAQDRTAAAPTSRRSTSMRYFATV